MVSISVLVVYPALIGFRCFEPFVVERIHHQDEKSVRYPLMNFESGREGNKIERTNRWFVNGADMGKGIVFRKVEKEETIRLPLELWGTE